MPWDLIQLNNGTSIPSIAFGTWTLGGGQQATNHVDQAISVGFSHIDTAQAYRNEAEAGVAIHESGLSREEIYITTKYSGVDGLDIDTSIQNSLKNLGVEYVDLYLIHNPRLAVPDIPTAWARMEKVQTDGYAKSIGVSNFNVPQLETLLASAKIKPVANQAGLAPRSCPKRGFADQIIQILFHPYVLESQAPIVEYGNENGIVSEAYSVLVPLTRQPGGPVDAPVREIASRLKVQPEQVLLAWAKAKGVVVVTSSTKKERLEGYLAAGDLELTDDDIAAIDAAGVIGTRRITARTFLRRAAAVALVGAAVLGACSYLGINVI
ncbi:Aldo/keto reductase [Laetiporus sulphureus 93-53]|uniref:Aldo/keto reductase n=1 Tax=Laetiporus sulphureus 93-53 TaxID=1314785 RepID=A0A165CXE8_9APHY|nr:Aldo/keto reductase [Laetiporus sulphureus 93-53]KZT03666.1 Aldo/keto reductase [Laetiporus sulphureus 93-53]